MRPEKAHMIVTNALQKYYRTGNPHLLYSSKLALRKLDKKLRADFKQMDIEYDDRDPYELTGYEDAESIINNVHYYSDRYNAPHRLNWLIVGVRDNKFPVIDLESIHG